MSKFGWIACFCIFIFVTVFVLSLDSSSSKRVKFTNQNFEIRNEANEVVNDTHTRTINLGKTNINNQNFNAYNKNLNADNQGINTYNQDINANNQDFNNKKYIKVNHSKKDYYSQDNNFSNNGNIAHKNLDDSRLDSALSNAGNYKYKNPEYGEFNYKYNNKKIPVLPPDEYEYQSIDWSRWKSNFVNKILDDSLEIKELDNYADGSWFYYSFIVDDQGRISNINVRSVYLTPEDKQKVARFIKGYQHTYLTKFPENSKRKTAKISAIMMLSNEETKHSKPSDFRDMEQVKHKINH